MANRLFCPVNIGDVKTRVDEYNRAYPKNPLGENWGYNLIGIWQARNNSNELPSISQMNSLLNEFTNEEVLLAIPIYNDGKATPMDHPHFRNEKELRNSAGTYNIEVREDYWTREQAQNEKDKVFLFGDNTDDRTRTNYVPRSTQAVIRGLPNAIGIDTKKNRGTDESSYFTDDDFDTFKKQVDKAIKEAKESGKTIVLPKDGIGTGKAQLKERAPKLFEYLQTKLEELKALHGKAKPVKSVTYKYVEPHGNNFRLYKIDNLEIFHSYYLGTLKGQSKSSTEVRQKAIERIFSENVAGIKNAEEFKSLLNNEKIGYAFALWHMQSIIMQVGNDEIDYNRLSREQKVEVQYRAYKEALIKVRAFHQSSGKLKSKVESMEMGRTHIKVPNSPIRELHRDFKPEQREERISFISRTFGIKVNEIQEKAIAEIKERLKTASATKAKELMATLKILESPDKGLAYALNTYGGVKRIKEELKAEYEEYVNLTDQERYKKESERKYVKIKLKRDAEESGADYNKLVEDFIRYKKETYEKVIKHFDLLFNEALSDIETRTGLIIKPDYTYSNTEDSVDETGELVEGADHEGETHKEGYLENARQTDPERSLSKKVKVLLSRLPDLTSDGKAKFDDLGEIKYLDPSKAYILLLEESSELIDPEQFGDKDNPLKFLKKLSTTYKWIKYMLKELEDKDGNIDYETLNQLYSALTLQKVIYYYSKGDFIASINSPAKEAGILSGIKTAIDYGRNLHKDAIYLEGGKINTSNLGKAKNLNNEVIRDLDEFEDLTDDEIAKLTENISVLFRMVGVNMSKSDAKNLLNDKESKDKLVNQALPRVNTILNGIDKMEEGSDLYSSFRNAYSIIAKNITISDMDNFQTSATNNGKQKYTYSAPNYVHKVVSHLSQKAKMTKTSDPNYTSIFDKFVTEEFSTDPFFFNAKTREWNCALLQMLTDKRNSEVRQKLAEIQMDSIDNVEFKDWTPKDILKMQLNAFLNKNETNEEGKRTMLYKYGYYAMPLFADAQGMILLRLPKFTDSDFKEVILNHLKSVVYQELIRMRRVVERYHLRKEGKLKGQMIPNYDIKSVKDLGFKFFPQLDQAFYRTVVGLLNEGRTSEVDSLIYSALEKIMNTEFNEFIKDKDVKRVFSDNVTAEQFFYNQTFMTTQMVMLTTSDLAFYKNATDFFKRYKEVYAAGNRMNPLSKKGKETRRTIYLQDQYLPSRSLLNIKGSLMRNKGLDKMARDFIISNFKHNNVTDAQAFLTPSEMAAMMDMLGKWSPEMETALEHFRESAKAIKEGKEPTWTMDDFLVVWQTLKPFMFTNKHNNAHTKDGGTIRTPLQYKNSEALMSFVLNLVGGDFSNKSGKMQALTDFMESKEIGAAMFGSAVKVGSHDLLDLNYSRRYLKSILDNGGTVKVGNTSIKITSYNDFMDKVINLLEEGKITQQEANEAIDKFELSYNETIELLEKHCLDENGEVNTEVIDEISYSDVMIAQSNPEHLFDETASFGSQFASIITADLPDEFTTNINGKTYTKESIRKLFNNIRFETLLDGFMSAREIFSNIHSLQTKLRDQISSNKNYSNDLIEALEIVEAINPHTGKLEEVFNIPMHTPTVSNQLVQLSHAVLKNKTTKQIINGGTAVLMSNFGLTDSLEIEYNEDGSLEGVQCMLPANSREHFTQFIDEYGRLDISKVPKEFLRGIGYRIPTEGKYSMVPLIVKGFLPQQNGSIIMVASDITTLSNSDFDVDKMFLMLPNLRSREVFDRKALKRDILALESDVVKKWNRGQVTGVKYSEALYSSRVDTLIDRIENGEEFEKGSIEKYIYDNVYLPNISKYNYRVTEKVTYNMKKDPSEQSKKARDNMLIDIAYSILTNEEIVSRLVTPSNFKDVTHAAKFNMIMNYRDNLIKFCEINGLSVPEPSDGKDTIYTKLKTIAKALLAKSDSEIVKFIEDYNQETPVINPISYATQHALYTIAGKTIGVFANSNTNQFKSQGWNIGTTKPVSLFGKERSRLTDIKSEDGKYISDTGSQYSAAVVDDAKNQNLYYLNINADSAKYVALLIRLGFNPIEIGVLMTCPEFNSYIYAKDLNAAASPSLEKLVMHCLKNTFGNGIEKAGILSKDEYKGLLAAIKNIKGSATVLNQVISNTKSDTMKGAIPHTIAGVHKKLISIEKLNAMEMKINPKLYGTSGIVENIFDVNFKTVSKEELREKFKDNNLKSPLISAFHNLGIRSILDLMSPYHIGYSYTMSDIMDTMSSLSSTGSLSDSLAVKLVNYYITYKLSDTKLFGDDDKMSYNEKRKYYTEKFPNDLKALFKKNPSLIANNKFLRNLSIDSKSISIPSPKEFTSGTAQLLKRSAVDLLYGSELEQDIAYKLLMYSYYTTGLNFMGNSVSPYLMTSGFLSSFPELTETLRFLKSNQETPSEFIDQVLHNINLKELAERRQLSMRDELRQYQEGEVVSVKTLGLQNREMLPQYVVISTVMDEYLLSLTESGDYVVIPNKKLKYPTFKVGSNGIETYADDYEDNEPNFRGDPEEEGFEPEARLLAEPEVPMPSIDEEELDMQQDLASQAALEAMSEEERRLELSERNYMERIAPNESELYEDEEEMKREMPEGLDSFIDEGNSQLNDRLCL